MFNKKENFNIEILGYRIFVISYNQQISQLLSNYSSFFVEPDDDPAIRIIIHPNLSLYQLIYKLLQFLGSDKIGTKMFESIFKYQLLNYENNLGIRLILPNKYKIEAFDNMLRIVFSSYCLNSNIMLLHASSIIIDDGLVLFIGKSGAGKSTIANYSGFEVFHDDLIVLKKESDLTYSFSTIPFKPPYSKKMYKGVLHKIYSIIQDDHDRIEEISIDYQLCLFLQSVWSFDEFGQNQLYNKKTIDFCREVLSGTSLSQLFFTKTRNFINVMIENLTISK